jgi:hypothetical protein
VERNKITEGNWWMNFDLTLVKINSSVSAIFFSSFFIFHYKNSLYFLQTFPTKIGFGVKQYHFLNNSEGRNFQCTFPTSSLVGNAFWPLNMLTWNPRNGSYKFICRKRFILKKEKENSNGHVGAQSSRHISYKYTRRNGFFFFLKKL